MDMEILLFRLDFARHGVSSVRWFGCRWEGPDKMFVVGLALNVGKCGRFRPKDAVVDQQSCEYGPITDAIERSPPETAQRFERWVVDLPDDLRSL